MSPEDPFGRDFPPATAGRRPFTAATFLAAHKKVFLALIFEMRWHLPLPKKGRTARTSPGVRR